MLRDSDRVVPTRDLDLLALEADGVGPLEPLRGVRVLSTGREQAFEIGGGVPAKIAEELRATRAPADPWVDPQTVPSRIEACRRVLAAHGWDVIDTRTCLVFLFPASVSVSLDVDIDCSDAPVPQWLRAANPGNWVPLEWTELLEGRLGPWAIASRGQRVVSICHTPVPMTRLAAECGVWTRPALRGRGYARAATAAWAEVARRAKPRLFYATAVDNRASRRVARRLGLRLLGHHRYVLASDDDALATGVHPLSTLRRPD